MLSNEITAYLESLIPSRDQIVQDMEAYAKENDVPIMELVGIEAMLQILRLIQPVSILEIGTAIGYSAIRMAKALPEANIVSIERDEIRYKKALEYIEMTNTSLQIKVHFGDALDLAECPENLGTSFDVIFIDAAKGQYQRFFNSYEKLLSDNGVIITDNVLFKGLVAAEEVEVKRTRSLVNKIKTYNEWLMSKQDFITTILPIGDGIAISKKRGV